MTQHALLVGRAGSDRRQIRLPKMHRPLEKVGEIHPIVDDKKSSSVLG